MSSAEYKASERTIEYTMIQSLRESGYGVQLSGSTIYVYEDSEVVEGDVLKFKVEVTFLGREHHKSK